MRASRSPYMELSEGALAYDQLTEASQPLGEPSVARQMYMNAFRENLSAGGRIGRLINNIKSAGHRPSAEQTEIEKRIYQSFVEGDKELDDSDYIRLAFFPPFKYWFRGLEDFPQVVNIIAGAVLFVAEWPFQAFGRLCTRMIGSGFDTLNNHEALGWQAWGVVKMIIGAPLWVLGQAFHTLGNTFSYARSVIDGACNVISSFFAIPRYLVGLYKGDVKLQNQYPSIFLAIGRTLKNTILLGINSAAIVAGLATGGLIPGVLAGATAVASYFSVFTQTLMAGSMVVALQGFNAASYKVLNEVGRGLKEVRSWMSKGIGNLYRRIRGRNKDDVLEVRPESSPHNSRVEPTPPIAGAENERVDDNLRITTRQRADSAGYDIAEANGYYDYVSPPDSPLSSDSSDLINQQPQPVSSTPPTTSSHASAAPTETVSNGPSVGKDASEATASAKPVIRHINLIIERRGTTESVAPTASTATSNQGPQLVRSAPPTTTSPPDVVPTETVSQDTSERKRTSRARTFAKEGLGSSPPATRPESPSIEKKPNTTDPAASAASAATSNADDSSVASPSHRPGKSRSGSDTGNLS